VNKAIHKSVGTSELTVIICTRDPFLPNLQKLADRVREAQLPLLVVSNQPNPGDFSDDEYLEVAVSKNFGFKKELLLAAWKRATTPYVLQLDDDVTLPPAYFHNLFQTPWSHLTLLPIYMENTQRFQFFDFLEHLALVLVGLNSNRSDKFTSCSGAHLLYSKSLANELSKNPGAFLATPSGDDMDLLICAQSRGLSISKPNPKHLWVSTPANTSLNSFFNQRVRWVRKPQSTFNNEAVFYGGFNILFYLLFLPTALLLSPPIGLVFLVLKWFMDFKTFEKNGPDHVHYCMWEVLLFELLYPFYIVTLFGWALIPKRNRIW